MPFILSQEIFRLYIFYLFIVPTQRNQSKLNTHVIEKLQLLIAYILRH
jgi:hypothetical protein